MEKYLIWSRPVLWLAAVVASIALTGCIPNKNSKLKNDIALVPDDQSAQTTHLFRQQLVYCTTQYLATAQVSEVKVAWVLKEKKLTIKSPDSKLDRYLTSCTNEAVMLMADVDDSGKMEISGIQLSDEPRI
ncbi:hypothetical protein [Citrobacter sp. U14242]|uniref:hypothetical protein n=1 Tax=Citrobacter sp. U14242 TaxID=3390192 RepID=UPI00397A707E